MAIAGEDDYAPSPDAAAAQQVELYERTDGAEGSEINGSPVVILYTIGAKTQKLRKTPLMRVADGDVYLVVGTYRGSPRHPQWVHNLRANPRVRVRDMDRVVERVARELEGDERAQWWQTAVATYPRFATYEGMTDRHVPLFVLEPPG